MVYWLPALAWMAVIFYLSSRTSNDLQALFPFIPDFEWGHLAAYFILACLLHLPLRRARVRHAGLWAVLLSLLYGISDEYHQRFVPTRQPDARDLAVDFAGAVLAACLLAWLRRRRAGEEEAR